MAAPSFLFNSKKGMTLKFLMELVFLLIVTFLLFFGAVKITTHESKYLVFDSQNLALLLERASSISGNFMYKIEFETPKRVDMVALDLKITDSRVMMDRTGSTTMGYVVEYQKPDSLRFLKDGESVEFASIKELYIYRIGDTLYVSDLERKDLAGKLDYIKNGNIPKYNSIHVFRKSIAEKNTGVVNYPIESLCTGELDDIPEDALVIVSGFISPDPLRSNEIRFYYSPETKNLALDSVNKLQSRFDNIVVALPVNENSPLQEMAGVSCRLEPLITRNLVFIKTWDQTVALQSLVSVYEAARLEAAK